MSKSEKVLEYILLGVMVFVLLVFLMSAMVEKTLAKNCLCGRHGGASQVETPEKIKGSRCDCAATNKK